MKRTIDRKIKLTDKELRKIIQDALLSYISDNTSNGNSGRIEGNIPDVSDLISKLNYANDAFVQDNISEINEGLIMTHDIHSAKNIICRKFNLQSQQFCITPINFDNTIVNLGVIILEKGTSQNVIGEIKHYMQTLGYFECVKPKYVEEKIVLIFEPHFSKDISNEIKDKYKILYHATNYQLDSLEELMEYMWLRPDTTNLQVDIFVDDGGSYLRHEHELLLFVRNGYDTSVQEFIPFSVSQTPMILNENIVRHISAKDITDVLHFIVKNQEALQALADREISQIEFVDGIVVSIN